MDSSLFNIIIFFFFLILFSSSISPSSSILAEASSSSAPSSSSSSSRPFENIYAFGDSYTDTGNTKSFTGPSSFMHVSNPPYGKTFFHHPTNRYSDGRLVIDFVSQSLSLPFLPPYRDTKADKSKGVNFAVAGSTAIIHSFFVENNLTLNITPQSLQTQLNWFNKFLEKRKGCIGSSPRECEAAFENALIWVGEIGANDYAYTLGSSVSSKTIQDISIASVTSFLKALLNKGAKYIVVQGLPPTGCLTLAMSLAPLDDRDEMGCVGSVNTQSHQHNTILQDKLIQLRHQFPHSLIVYADYWNSYSWIMKNATHYGFKQLFRVCCGSGGGLYNFEIFNTCGSPSNSSSSSCQNPSHYINWDGVHLTEAMYKAVADLFINGTFSHPPFRYLIKMKLGSHHKYI